MASLELNKRIESKKIILYYEIVRYLRESTNIFKSDSYFVLYLGLFDSFIEHKTRIFYLI